MKNMYRVCLTISAFLLAAGLLTAGSVNACMDHYFFGQGNNSFFHGSNTASRFVSAASKNKVFKVKHSSAKVAVIGESTNLDVSYEIPPASKGVKLEFAANEKVDVIDQNIAIDDQSGTVTARFKPLAKGLNIITVTVSGEHEGEEYQYSSRVYVSTKAAKS